MKSDGNYEEYKKDLLERLINSLNCLTEMAQRIEIPSNSFQQSLWELISYIEDFIEKLKRK